jgi:hypothetical protein
VLPVGRAASKLPPEPGHQPQAVQLADKIIAATSLEAPPAWWPGFFPPSFRLDNLRQVLLHVIAETACHTGHLDARP